jgi:hypothetical protein
MAARIHKGIFTRVKVARELLRQKAEEIFTEYMDVIQKAKDSGNYDAAAKHLQWLMEHMPAEEDGTRMVDSSVDKRTEVIDSKPSGPAIQIGIKVGGIGENQKKLPAPIVEVIDVAE